MNDFLQLAVKAIDEKHGIDIKVLDISKLSVLADYFIIAHGTNAPQIDAIVQNIDFRLSKQGIEPKAIEDSKNGGWTLLDYGHTIIHIFGQDERLFYDLERLWIEGKPVIFDANTPSDKEALEKDQLS